jgi:hypothetical protein
MLFGKSKAVFVHTGTPVLEAPQKGGAQPGGGQDQVGH